MENLITSFLNYGFLLQINYVCGNDNLEKYAYIMKGKWYNKLPFLPTCEEPNTMWNVITHKPWSFKNKHIKDIHYCVWPKGADYSEIVSSKDLLNEQDCFLIKDEDFVDEIALFILLTKLRLQNHLKKNCVDSFDSYDLSELQDRCSLIFYPKQTQLLDKAAFETLKDTVIDEFFTYAFQTVPELNYFPALKMYGVSQKYIDSTDPALVEPFKRQWCRLIDKEKRLFLEHVTNIDLTEFTEEEKAEFFEEVEIIREELNDDINESINSAKCLKEVITFWPKLLQPKPHYVYTE